MIVRENINFKRGISSKKSLDVGISRKENIQEFLEKGLESALGEFAAKYAVWYNDHSGKHFVHYYEMAWMQTDKDVSMVRLHVDYYNWNKRYQNYFKKKVINWFKENTDFKIIRFFKDRGREYTVHFKTMMVSETFNFERKLDSKKSLDIGVYRKGQIKRYLEPTDPMFFQESYNWLIKNPILAKQLGVKSVIDIGDLLSLEADYTCEMNDLDAQNLEDQFSPGLNQNYSYQSNKNEPIWIWNIGSLDDGSKIIYYLIGLNSGYIARKEWIK